MGGRVRARPFTTPSASRGRRSGGGLDDRPAFVMSKAPLRIYAPASIVSERTLTCSRTLMTNPRADSARQDRSQPGEAFAKVVPRLLAERSWSQRDLARRVDVDPAHICRLLGPTSTGGSPDLMLRVAEAFGVPPDSFAFFTTAATVRSRLRSSDADCFFDP